MSEQSDPQPALGPGSMNRLNALYNHVSASVDEHDPEQTFQLELWILGAIIAAKETAIPIPQELRESELRQLRTFLNENITDYETMLKRLKTPEIAYYINSERMWAYNNGLVASLLAKGNIEDASKQNLLMQTDMNPEFSGARIATIDPNIYRSNHQ